MMSMRSSGAGLVGSMIRETGVPGGTTAYGCTPASFIIRKFRRTSSTIILRAGPEQLDMKKPVTDEICRGASLPIAIDGARFMVFVGLQPSFCTPGELVGGDLPLPGEILVTGWSLKRQKKMAKQRFAEMKLTGDLAGRDPGLVNGQGGAGALEI